MHEAQDPVESHQAGEFIIAEACLTTNLSRYKFLLAISQRHLDNNLFSANHIFVTFQQSLQRSSDYQRQDDAKNAAIALFCIGFGVLSGIAGCILWILLSLSDGLSESSHNLVVCLSRDDCLSNLSISSGRGNLVNVFFAEGWSGND